MKKTNRLINVFKEQTKDTICKHMNALAAMNYSLYSTSMCGLFPHLQNHDIYIYADSETVVLVCLDCCGNDEEQTYEESEEVGPFIYRTGSEPRISMVWALSEEIDIIKNYLQDHHGPIQVYGILLTEANIVNADDMEDIWEN